MLWGGLNPTIPSTGVNPFGSVHTEVQCGRDEMLLYLLKVESRSFPGLGSACHSLQ